MAERQAEIAEIARKVMCEADKKLNKSNKEPKVGDFVETLSYWDMIIAAGGVIIVNGAKTVAKAGAIAAMDGPVPIADVIAVGMVITVILPEPVGLRWNTHQEIGVSVINEFRLPTWHKVEVDMLHIVSGHTEGGGKDKSPKGMTEVAILKAIEVVYKNAEKVGSLQYSWQNGIEMVRQQFQGTWNGYVIEFWINYITNVIEAAYPKW